MSKKPRANRLGMYADVREVADMALAHGGGSYTCATYGEARHWQQRFYRFRKLHAEIYHEDSESPYDRLVLPRIPPESCVVTINIRQAPGYFKPAGPQVAKIEADDELFDVAKQLAAKYGGSE